jgi:hypothetical protein
MNGTRVPSADQTGTLLSHPETSLVKIALSRSYTKRPRSRHRCLRLYADQLVRAFRENVRPLLAFAVMAHLLPTRLPDVHVRRSLKMIGANLLGHRRSFSRSRHPARSQHVSHQLAAVGVEPDPGTSATGLVVQMSALVAVVAAR